MTNFWSDIFVKWGVSVKGDEIPSRFDAGEPGNPGAVEAGGEKPDQSVT